MSCAGKIQWRLSDGKPPEQYIEIADTSSTTATVLSLLIPHGGLTKEHHQIRRCQVDTPADRIRRRTTRPHTLSLDLALHP